MSKHRFTLDGLRKTSDWTRMENTSLQCLKKILLILDTVDPGSEVAWDEVLLPQLISQSSGGHRGLLSLVSRMQYLKAEGAYNCKAISEDVHAALQITSPKVVEQVEQDYRRFKKRVLKNFPARSEEVQTSQEGLLQGIDSVVTLPELRDRAQLALNDTHHVKARWQEKGLHGVRKISRLGQEFATNFAGFVRVYAGFVDLARQAGGPYAEVAYGTLSLFFMVAVQKSENDERFIGTMKELQNEFPRIEMVDNLYSHASVKDRVSQVYSQVIIFAREATKYFLAHHWGRMMKAIFNPAPLGIDKVIEELHRSLAEVNAQIGILLHKRVLEIRDTNEELVSRNQELLLEIRDLKTEVTSLKDDEAQKVMHKDEERLMKLRHILGGDPEEHREPRFCKENLQHTFPDALEEPDVRQGFSANYEQMTRELLWSDSSYRAWMEYPDSSLLVLAGSTKPGGRAPQSSPGCWLSPAIIHVSDHLRSQGKKVFFYTCQPNFREESTSSRMVMSSLVCQVLQWKPEKLRYKGKEFTSMIESDAWSSKDGPTAIACHINLLTKAICSEPKEEEIAIVIDRLDLCRERTHLLLRELRKLLKRRSSGLKVLVVMESITDDDVRGECLALLDEAAADDGLFGRMTWDQSPKGY
ncbi:MAG: hypothetical protein Q9204_002405 [Flavoplaca sp. TL-2023a]